MKVLVADAGIVLLVSMLAWMIKYKSPEQDGRDSPGVVELVTAGLSRECFIHICVLARRTSWEWQTSDDDIDLSERVAAAERIVDKDI